MTGGAGIAISATSNIAQAKMTLRDKTAAQIIVEARTILTSLGVPEETANRLLENRNYTPADLLIMAQALARLGAHDGDAANAWVKVMPALARRCMFGVGTSVAPSGVESSWP